MTTKSGHHQKHKGLYGFCGFAFRLGYSKKSKKYLADFQNPADFGPPDISRLFYGFWVGFPWNPMDFEENSVLTARHIFFQDFSSDILLDFVLYPPPPVRPEFRLSRGGGDPEIANQPSRALSKRGGGVTREPRRGSKWTQEIPRAH